MRKIRPELGSEVKSRFVRWLKYDAVDLAQSCLSIWSVGVIVLVSFGIQFNNPALWIPGCALFVVPIVGALVYGIRRMWLWATYEEK